MKLVTPSALVERLKINSSLARAACKFLAEVRPVVDIILHSIFRDLKLVICSLPIS